MLESGGASIEAPEAERAYARWLRSSRVRRAMGVVVVLALVAVGLVVWRAADSGPSGYRTAQASSETVSSTLDVSGTVGPVNEATADFQVAGTVASVGVSLGQQVSAGQALASLDPTPLQQDLTSAQSTLASDQAKLSEDEAGEASTTAAVSGGSGITLDALSEAGGTLASDQAAVVADQKQEGVDATAASAALSTLEACISSSTSTTTTTTTVPTSGTTACASDVSAVAAAQTVVSTDQANLATAESALAQLLSSSASSSSSSATTGSSSSTHSSTGSTGGSSSATSGGSSTTGEATDSAEQLATDEAAIDTAEAEVVNAQQSLAEANLMSPLSGTVASVGVTTGMSVSSGSTTDAIVIVNTGSFQATGSLTSSQVPGVKTGDKAAVSVDGQTGTLAGTVARVGPVSSSDDTYTYPLVVALGSGASGLPAGATAQIQVVLDQVHAAVAVPTSAVHTVGTDDAYVLVMKAGTPTRKKVVVGVVGADYTQVTSGLNTGAVVELANLGEALPSSDSNSLTTGGGGGFGGGGRFTSGGGTFTRASAAG